jgi:hypothetical protein
METWFQACDGRVEPVEVVHETPQKVKLHAGYYELKTCVGQWIRLDRDEAKRLMIAAYERDYDAAKSALIEAADLLRLARGA